MPNQIPPGAALSRSANDNGPLTSGQVKALKIAIAIMSFLIVAILIVIVARVIYLATIKNKSTVSPGSGTVQTTTTTATPVPGAKLAPRHQLALPAGAALGNVALHGNRLLVNFRIGTEHRLKILDLVTGKTISEVTITSAPASGN